MTCRLPLRALVLGFATSTAAIAFAAPARAQEVPPTAPAIPAQPAPEADGGDEEAAAEIVVTGQRERGSVPGDIRSEQVLRPADIRAYGVSSLSDLLTELAPQLGSGRGQGGLPVVLLNGRRISGFRDIQSYPPEAIERVDILPPEAAQQLGYRADQRVVNFVLRRRFNAVTAEVEGGGATGGDRYTADIDVGLLRIQRDKRLNLAFEFDARTPVYESDRDLLTAPATRPFAIGGSVFPTGSSPNTIGAFRTLSSAQRNVRATANYARPIFGTVDASITAALDIDKSTSELGLATAGLTIPAGNPFSPFAASTAFDRYLVEGGARGRATERSQQQLGTALNGDIGRWRWSFTGNYTRTLSNTRTDNNFDLSPFSSRLSANDPTFDPFARFDTGLLGAFRQDTARSLNNTTSVETQINGPLFALPAGDARASVRTGFNTTDLAARSIRSGVTTVGDLDRDTGTGQVRIDLPIASRSRGVLAALGTLSANASYAYEQTSDFGWLSTYSFGVTWAPVQNRLFLLATVTQDENAPSINQLGDPIVVTPNARVFDFVRGESVETTATSGGNPGLRAREPRTFNLTFNARPFTSIDLNLNGEYTRTRTLNPIEALSTATAAIEAAFPNRFQRDPVTRRLLRVDNRPVNVARSDQEQLRWGFNFSRRIGPTAPAGGRFGGGGERGAASNGPARPAQPRTPEATVGTAGPTQRPQAQQQRPSASQGGTTVVIQDGPPRASAGSEGRRAGGFGGGGRGGFGGFGGGGGNEGRVQLSVFHTWRFRDTLLIGPGIPELDRLNGDATDPIGGPRKHTVEFNAGINKDGFGLRADGRWQSGTFVRGGSTRNPTDVMVEPLTTIRLRGRVDFGPQMSVARDHPWLIGTRVELSVSNLFDVRPRVTDASGTVPINFQPDLIDPIGRTVSLSIRKLFFNRPQAARRR